MVSAIRLPVPGPSAALPGAGDSRRGNVGTSRFTDRIVGTFCRTSIMSRATRSTATKAPSPRRMLDGFPPDTRVVIADVTWDDYERLADAIREGEHCRIAFDGTDIEMMTLGPFHEREKSLVELFMYDRRGRTQDRAPTHGFDDVEAEEAQACDRVRSMLLLRPCQVGAAAAAAHSDDVGLYPNPDLAVEIDISRPKIDRPGIYAALQMPEFWRANKQSVAIQHLSSHGKYVLANRSRFLPVRSEDVTRWVFTEDSVGLVAWEERLRVWVRNELVSGWKA